MPKAGTLIDFEIGAFPSNNTGGFILVYRVVTIGSLGQPVNSNWRRATELNPENIEGPEWQQLLDITAPQRVKPRWRKFLDKLFQRG